jgi:hypothetical protein
MFTETNSSFPISHVVSRDSRYRSTTSSRSVNGSTSVDRVAGSASGDDVLHQLEHCGGEVVKRGRTQERANLRSE